MIVRTLSRLIYKTAICGQILCDSKEFLSKFSLIIVVSNGTKRKEIKKMIIGISKFLILVLKNRKYEGVSKSLCTNAISF